MPIPLKLRIGTVFRFKEKVELYRLIAKNPGLPAPPEAHWYGMWSFVLHDIANEDALLLVFPQLSFRIETRNSVPGISQSTRYTDVALMDSVPNNIENENLPLTRVTTKVLIALEVKPPVPEDVPAHLKSRKEDLQFRSSELSAKDQVLHHFSMKGRQAAERVIAIAAVGDQWKWSDLQRRQGATPAYESTRAAAPYLDDHQNIISAAEVTETAWSPILLFGSDDSTRHFKDILTILNDRRAYQ